MNSIFFDILTAAYTLQSQYIIASTAQYLSTFSSQIDVYATYNQKENNYDFQVKRIGVEVDGKPVHKLLDRVMYRIGNSIYPVELKVSPSHQILDVINYEDIVERWKNSTTEVKNLFPSPILDSYINSSQRNILNKNSFIRSLFQDTFFNIYFRDVYTPMEEDEVKMIVWHNFPKRKMNQTYLYHCSGESNLKSCRGEIIKILPDAQGKYLMNYEIGEKGEIISVQGQIETPYQEDHYSKKVLLKSTSIKAYNLNPNNIVI